MEKLFDETGVSSNVHEFRDRIGEIMIDSGKIPHTQESYSELCRDIQRYREEARNSYMTELQLVVSFLSLIGVFVYTGVIVSIFLAGVGVLLTIYSIFQSVLIGVTAYEIPKRRKRHKKMVFMKNWNKGPINSRWSPFLITLVGFLAIVHRGGFELGVEIIRDKTLGSE